MTKRFKLNGKRCHQVWSSEAPRRVMLFLSYEPFFLLLLFAKQRKFVNIERFLYKELQISLLPRVRKRKLLAVVANIGDGGCLRRKMMAASKHVNSALPMDLHCKHPLRGLKISFAMREAARTEIFYGVFHPCLTFTLTVGRWRSRQRILRSSGSLRGPFDVKLFVEARAKRGPGGKHNEGNEKRASAIFHCYQLIVFPFKAKSYLQVENRNRESGRRLFIKVY